jgi:hypothetical protein
VVWCYLSDEGEEDVELTADLDSRLRHSLERRVITRLALTLHTARSRRQLSEGGRAVSISLGQGSEAVPVCVSVAAVPD